MRKVNPVSLNRSGRLFHLYHQVEPVQEPERCLVLDSANTRVTFGLASEGWHVTIVTSRANRSDSMCELILNRWFSSSQLRMAFGENRRDQSCKLFTRQHNKCWIHSPWSRQAGIEFILDQTVSYTVDQMLDAAAK